MNREDIIRMAREAGVALGKEVTNYEYSVIHRFAALVAAAERNKVAQWMMAKGYATGHGDTVEDLLQELEWQVREAERESCAKVCDAHTVDDVLACVGIGQSCAAAIRARGQA